MGSLFTVALAAYVSAFGPFIVVPNTANDSLKFVGALAANYGPTIGVYIVWYSNPSNPWSSAEKQLVRDWVNNFTKAPTYNVLRGYPAANGNMLGSLYVGGEVDDLETQGTRLTPSVEVARDFSLHVENGDFPQDDNGIYVLMPSDVDVTLTNGDSGYNFPFGVLYGAVVTRSTGFTADMSPNGDEAFDREMIVMSHEIPEGLEAGWTSFVNGNQIADPCEGAGAFIAADLSINPAGYPYSWGFQGPSGMDYFIMQPLWSREYGGHCLSDIPRTSVNGTYDQATCQVNADCLWSLHCVQGVCAEPSCSDSIQNQHETDVDCGASCGWGVGIGCGVGKHCDSSLDCPYMHSCVAGLCN